MKTTYSRDSGELTAEQQEQVEALLSRPDRKIDTSDIPERPEGAWKNAVRGRDVPRLWRPVKQAVSLRLDADVIAWLKKDGAGYQTRANQLLRERMMQELEGR